MMNIDSQSGENDAKSHTNGCVITKESDNTGDSIGIGSPYRLRPRHLSSGPIISSDNVVHESLKSTHLDSDGHICDSSNIDSQDADNSDHFDDTKSDGVSAINVQDLHRLMSSNESLDTLAQMVSLADGTSNAEKHRQQFVTAWLIRNYQTDQDASILRSAIYEHYVILCKGYSIRPINQASFGKFIRSVFPGITTRRLGTRRSSKYHYCGVREKTKIDYDPNPDTNLDLEMQSLQADYAAAKVLTQAAMRSNGNNSIGFTPSRGRSPAWIAKRGSFPPTSLHQLLPKSNKSTIIAGKASYYTSQEPRVPMSLAFERLYYVADSTVAQNVSSRRQFQGPRFPPPFNSFYPGHNNDMDELKTVYYGVYERHCNDVLEMFKYLKLGETQRKLIFFWSNLSNPYRQLVSTTGMDDWIWRTDAILYENMLLMIESLITQIIPKEVVTSLRLFARSIEDWTEASMSGYSVILVQKRLDAIRSFRHLLLSNLNTNMAAQAVGQILIDQEYLLKMRTDWELINLHDIEESLLWIKSGDSIRDYYFAKGFWVDFGLYINSKTTIEHFINWIDLAHTKYKGNITNYDYSYIIYANTQFLFKWHHSLNKLISELTRYNASSFGGYQIIRLFLDDYVSYLVEKDIWKSRMARISPLGEFGKKNYEHDIDQQSTDDELVMTPH